MFFIYRLTDGELDYYGQTDNIPRRMRSHRCSSENSRSKLLDKSKMKLHIIHRLYTQEEADETEAFYILNFDCVNYKVTGRTQKEWHAENKDRLKIEKAQYDFDHKEEKAEYRKKHKERIANCVSNYYQKNKDKINAKNSVPYECECGSVVRWGDKSAHFKSQKHRYYINQK